jgi:hypothetical protein
MTLVAIHTEVVVNLEDWELQDMISTSQHLTGLGDESVDHLLRDGDLIEVHTSGSTVTLRFVGVRVVDGAKPDLTGGTK